MNGDEEEEEEESARIKPAARPTPPEPQPPPAPLRLHGWKPLANAVPSESAGEGLALPILLQVAASMARGVDPNFGSSWREGRRKRASTRCTGVCRPPRHSCSSTLALKFRRLRLGQSRSPELPGVRFRRDVITQEVRWSQSDSPKLLLVRSSPTGCSSANQIERNDFSVLKSALLRISLNQ
ncbi:hypothetical protein MHYP_G00304330 [Metynnis hypsauchen]